VAVSAGTGGAVLVLRALGLGDLLTAVPALRGLRRALPGERIALAAPAALADLLPLVGAVDALLPTRDLRDLDWCGAPPRLAVNLHGSGPESVLALASAGAPEVWTHEHEAFPHLRGPRWVEDQHEVARWARMLRHFDVPVDTGDLHLAQPAEPLLPGSVVLHPGASTEARRWPAERFAEVAAQLARAGEQVVLTGDAGERDRALRVAELADLPPEAVLAGRTSLTQLVALVSGARLVLCGDTGLGHVATACATPSVLLFGPVSPHRWGPPDRAQHVVLWSGSTGDTFADEPDPGLLQLSVDEVVRSCEELLDTRPVAGRR